MLTNMYYDVETEAISLIDDEWIKTVHKYFTFFGVIAALGYALVMVSLVYSLKQIWFLMGVIIAVGAIITLIPVLKYKENKINVMNSEEKIETFIVWLKHRDMFQESKIDDLINEIDEWISDEKDDVTERFKGVKVIFSTIAVAPIALIMRPTVKKAFSSMDWKVGVELSGTIVAMTLIFIAVYIQFNWKTVLVIGYNKKQKVRYLLKDVKYRIK